jgi:uncharacterized protein (DUF305 family)
MVLSSARTDDAHPTQLIPATVMVVVLMAFLSGSGVKRPLDLCVPYPPRVFKMFEGSVDLMSQRSLLAGAGAVGATLVLLLSGCSTTGTEAQDDGHTDQESTSQAADGASTHNDADASFARDMIPHHEQAIVMSDIMLAKQGIDPRVVELATQIKAAQGPEIATMKQWLTEWGTPQMPSGHEGHDMSGDMTAEMGMMSEQQLAELRTTQGVDASRLFLTGMIAHHEGAVRMAQTEIDRGQSEDAKHLAEEIIETQQLEIDTMKQLLGSL